MYRTLCVAAILLATIVFTSGNKPADASAVGQPSPVIVARLSLTNQTQQISTTTLFTPPVTGLYRVSVYFAMTKNVNSQEEWLTSLYFTDDGGFESMSGDTAVARLNDFSTSIPPVAWAVTHSGDPVAPVTFRAIAGTPVSYSVGGPATGDTYDLFIVAERLM
jgi:hypothetical protein